MRVTRSADNQLESTVDIPIPERFKNAGHTGRSGTLTVRQCAPGATAYVVTLDNELTGEKSSVAVDLHGLKIMCGFLKCANPLSQPKEVK